MSRVRVLFVEATRGRGGSATCLVRFVPRLAPLGVTASVLGYQVNDRIARLRDVGVPVIDLALAGVVPPEPIVLAAGFLPLPSAGFLRVVAGTWRAIQALDPDVVYLNSPLRAHLPALLAAQALRRPVVCHYREHLALTRLERLAVRSLDAFVVLSDTAREHFVREGVPRERVLRVYDGFDLEAFDAQAGSGASVTDAETFTLAIVGALIPRKGHAHLFEAARRLGGKLRLRILCVGTGAQEQALQQEARRLDAAASVSFLGYREDIPAILQSVDACVVPSLQEGGLTMAAKEAMAARKPVIHSDLPGLREFIVDGETGLLVPAADPQALAAAIERLALDRATARRLGENGRRLLESGSLSAENEARGIVEAIRAALAGRGSRPEGAGLAAVTKP